MDIRRQYRKLAHPNLAAQVRPYICDSTKGIVVRRVAIDIAEDCELQTLQDELANIALDPSEPILIRVQAAYAVGRIGSDKTKARLKPLVTGKAEDDPDDQLKGCGLKAIWPTHMTIEELFAVLTPPKRTNFYGSYHSFLSSSLVRHLTLKDLPVALKWVESHIPTRTSWKPFEELVNAIMVKAWENLEWPGVLEAFARAVLSRLKHHEYIVASYYDQKFKSVISNDDEKRRRLLEAMIPMISDPEKDSISLFYPSAPLLTSKDLLWMVERLQAEKSKEIQVVWAQLIRIVFNPYEPDQLEVIFAASQNNPILGGVLAPFLKPVELNSSEAQQMRTDYLRIQEWQESKEDQPFLEPLLEPPPAKPTSTHYGSEFESDLTVLPGWKSADPLTRSRIVKAAKNYVLERSGDS